MIRTHSLGFPRIGPNRELKTALEAHWKGQLDEQGLNNVASTLRKASWQQQIDAGLDFITVGDFALYDHVASHIQRFGCEPARFGFTEQHTPLQRLFGMVRGQAPGVDTFALEMTKWFDTNYHYMVPEFSATTAFKLDAQELLEQVAQAQTLNHPIKVALLGPLSFLYLGKSKTESLQPLNLLTLLLPEYEKLLAQLKQAGVTWVQLEEPILGLDLDSTWLLAMESALQRLKQSGPKLLLATYFSGLNGHISQVCKWPVDGLHVDCVRAPEELAAVLDWLPNYKVLSLGLIDGRNIWRTDLNPAGELIQQALNSGKNELWIAPSCSLLHVPYQLSTDEGVDARVRPWLAGVQEKLIELALLKAHAKTLLQGKSTDSAQGKAWAEHQQWVQERHRSALVHKPQVQARLANLAADADRRQAPYEERRELQAKALNLPLLPTTTIGSFPQTPQIRAARAALRKGELTQADYDAHMAQEIRTAIEFQNRLGLDVLVHGEAERNDMVEYFGEQLEGYTFSRNGWVQSYGSRCVKPPILFGDVERPKPMTVEVSAYAQSLTDKPVKGMLTGPVTLLQWSFVRDDQPREATALQLALAVRDEVADLQGAGIQIIQLDEPAFREGLPLRKAAQTHYLSWAARAFRIAAGSAFNDTQIHTHMCYSEFNDILDHIAALDADVITIETSRSDMELLRAFGDFKYPNEIGPGVYDIHSPRIPKVGELERLIHKALQVIPAERLWINPDCGLKTRQWHESEEALKVMMQATFKAREQLLSEHATSAN
ncbi:MAG: 5-methyltetrahydropteroyltriglutamate--homocysteine S-methyltransferase [Limnobacter sp.]|uniref:5-methyltetrahydropteroyltriglutamate-- homocysteine S-methyltransferase n=1 Tax=Limnobacter sp. TaxID=2003368 RepID=UPI00391B460E